MELVSELISCQFAFFELQLLTVFVVCWCIVCTACFYAFLRFFS